MHVPSRKQVENRKSSKRAPKISVTSAPTATKATYLLQHAIDLVLVVELEHLGGLVGSDLFTVQQKAEAARLNALALRVRVKDLLHARRPLDFEKRLFSGLRAGGTGREKEKCTVSGKKREVTEDTRAFAARVTS